MKRIDLYITENQLNFLKKLSGETGLSFSEHIRRAIDNYIKEYTNDQEKMAQKRD